MLVEFTNVGRGKKSWRANIAEHEGMPGATSLLRSVEKSNALMSLAISVTYDDGDKGGKIFVGSPVGRHVGDWRVCQPLA